MWSVTHLDIPMKLQIPQLHTLNHDYNPAIIFCENTETSKTATLDMLDLSYIFKMFVIIYIMIHQMPALFAILCIL